MSDVVVPAVKEALCVVDFFKECDKYGYLLREGLGATSIKVHKGPIALPIDARVLNAINVAHVFFKSDFKMVDRAICEDITDGSLVQVIPYVVVRRGSKVIAYNRGYKSGEGRLLGKASIGFGGHVDSMFMEIDDDVLFDSNRDSVEPDRVSDFFSHLLIEAERELEEELGVTGLGLMGHSDKLFFSLITANPSDDLTEAVSKAHIGYVIDINLDAAEIKPLAELFDSLNKGNEHESPEEHVIGGLRVIDGYGVLDDLGARTLNELSDVKTLECLNKDFEPWSSLLIQELQYMS